MGIQASLLLGAAKAFIGFIRPDSDIETSGWTTTPLWNKLDETSPDDATTQITSSNGTTECPTVDNRDFEVTLTNPPTTPSGFETVTIRMRGHFHTTAGNLTTKQFRVQVKELTTIRRFELFTAQSTYTTHSFTLTQAEKDAIGNWNDLRINVNFQSCHDAAGGSSHAHVTWIEVEFS